MQTDEQRLIARVLGGHAEDYGYFLERYGPEAIATRLHRIRRKLYLLMKHGNKR